MGQAKFDYHRYRVPETGAISLASIQSDDDQGLKEDYARKRLQKNLDDLQEFQERLYAESRQSVLLVLQAMDTGGKDSTIRKIANDIGRGARPRLPVAHPQGRSADRQHRHLQPLALRGRARRPGAQYCAADFDRKTLSAHQRF